MNNLLKKINEFRQTVKSYSDQKITNENWSLILESIYWAPSSHGYEPYRVIIIPRDHKLRTVIKPMMWNQGVVTEADKLIFFISLKRSVFNSDEWLYKRGFRKNSKVLGMSDKQAMIESKKSVKSIQDTHLNFEDDDWSMKQAYIALGIAMTHAAILQISTTPMEGIAKDKLEHYFVKQGIIKENERIAVGLAFGYPKNSTSYAHEGKGQRVRDDYGHKFITL